MKSSSSFRGVQVRKWFVFLACVDIVWTLHGCQKSDLRPEVFNCSFSNLTSYPSNVPADVTILDVSHNALEKIGILNTTLITHLNLSNNIIQNIQHNAFTDMKNLVKLDLSFNLLKGSKLIIQRYRFELSEFHSLKWLSFRGNPLGFVSRMTFTQFGYLKLEELDLSYCGITTLEEMALSNLVRLKKLHLQYNNIENLSGESFNTLGELEELHLDHNKIRTLGQLTFMSLQTLYLNFNNIDRLKGDTLTHLVKLRNLELDHNKLRYFAPNSFPDDLQSVSLNGNPWRCDCNMKWVLDNTKWKQFFQNSSLICTFPSRYRGRNILSLEADDLICLTSPLGILTIVLLILTIMVLMALGTTIVYKKRHCFPCLKDPDGHYVAVYTTDDYQDEPRVSISDEKTLVKEVEIYA